jgi:hypothetical protein
MKVIQTISYFFSIFFLLLRSQLKLSAQKCDPTSHVPPFPPLRMLGCITADIVREICICIIIYAVSTTHPKHTTPRSHTGNTGNTHSLLLRGRGSSLLLIRAARFPQVSPRCASNTHRGRAVKAAKRQSGYSVVHLHTGPCTPQLFTNLNALRSSLLPL